MHKGLSCQSNGSLLLNKLKKLKDILKEMESVLVAYSGGADSTFLLKTAKDVLGENVLAVTAKSETYPQEELDFSMKTANTIGVKQRTINTGELKNKDFYTNPVNRCYFCKRELFGKLKTIAEENNLNFVLDGSNISDKKDFRPGSLAKKEFGIRSPLQEAGLKKEDIRRLSRKIGLVSWDKPQSACLASRIPYGEKITAQVLKRIHKAELFLRQFGFKYVRLRHYGRLCRIEVAVKEIPGIILKRNSIVENFKKLGYNYITLDLEGYRSGSMNYNQADRIQIK